MRTRFLLPLCAIATCLPLPAADEPAAAARLPKVLIIGDSISIGYTPHVKRLMDGRALVERHAGNAGDTRNGLAKIDAWLGDTSWDVIHFNWGLHDLCYRNPAVKANAGKDKLNGAIAVPPAQYEANLEQLAERLKKTGARLVWANTTFVPEGEPGRKTGDDLVYNEAAARVMRKHAIPVNDLHALSAAFPAKLFVRPGDVHFTEAGYGKLAAQVAAAIEAALAAEKPAAAAQE
jgi:lysophospholipase L1-like esterase